MPVGAGGRIAVNLLAVEALKGPQYYARRPTRQNVQVPQMGMQPHSLYLGQVTPPLITARFIDT